MQGGEKVEDDDLQVNMTLNTDDYMDNIRQVIDKTKEFKGILNETMRVIESQRNINLSVKIRADSREFIEETSLIKNNLVQVGSNKKIKIEAKDMAKTKFLDTVKRINEFSKKPKKIVLDAVYNTKKNADTVKDNISRINNSPVSKKLRGSTKSINDNLKTSEVGEQAKSSQHGVKNLKAAEGSPSESSSFDFEKVIKDISKLVGDKSKYKKILEPISKIAADKDKTINDIQKVASSIKKGNVGKALKNIDTLKVGGKGWQDALEKLSKSSKIKGAPKEALNTIMQVVKNSQSMKASDKDAGKVKTIVDSLKNGVKAIGINIPALNKLDGGKLGKDFAELKKNIKVIEPVLKKLEKTKAFSKLKKQLDSLNSGSAKKIINMFKEIEKHPKKIEQAFKRLGKVVTPFSKAIKEVSTLMSKKFTLASVMKSVPKLGSELKKGFSEVKSIIDDLAKRSKTVKKFSDDVKSSMDSIGSVLKNKLLKIVTTSSTVIQSAARGVFALFQTNPIVLAITAIVAACVILYEAWKHNWGGIRDKTKAVVDEIKKIWKGLTDFLAHPIKASINFFKGIFGGKADGSHATGLSYVPYNGYVAELHEGERVLTAQQNRSMANGSGGLSIAKLADTIVVREQADIDRIANALARKINAAALNM